MNKPTTLTYLDRLILNVLIQWIRENKDKHATLTYKQVVEKVNHPSIIPVNLSPYLGRILHYCLEHNIPVITAIVINQNASEPGAGFFEAIGANVTPEKHHEYWETICEQVYSYDKWDELFIGAKAE